MQDEDIHYADALFPLIHTRVNDSFVSVSAPDDRAAVLHSAARGDCREHGCSLNSDQALQRERILLRAAYLHLY